MKSISDSAIVIGDKNTSGDNRPAAKAGFMDRMYRRLILKLLARLQIGHLHLTEGDRSWHFGQSPEQTDIVARIDVHQPWAYRQVLLHGSIGSGEAYMLRGWTSPDLLQVVRLFVRNADVLGTMDGRLSAWKIGFSRLLHVFNANTVSGSRSNIAAHYDLSNEFFGTFLDPWRMYSSGVYTQDSSSLDQAAVDKLDRVCRGLQLTPEDHLLEIGTGWGGMAIYAAKHYGCRVTTTTISAEQHQYAQEWIEREGLSDRITLLCQDYRELTGKYDKLVSIEMIEAVGHRYYSRFFQQCSQLLKENGLMLIQAITIADQRYHQAKNSVDFIQRYIFPGGALPSMEAIARHVSRDTNMQVVSLSDITRDYALTLAAWRERFWGNIDKVRALGFDDIFERMWDFYLVYCQGGFQERVISTVQVLMAKPDSRNLPRFIG